jgi:Holliday junction resolvase-like predicted endonuclease
MNAVSNMNFKGVKNRIHYPQNFIVNTEFNGVLYRISASKSENLWKATKFYIAHVSILCHIAQKFVFTTRFDVMGHILVFTI